MNPTTFAKLYSIFSSKRWHDKEMHEIVFKNFCDLLGNLNDCQQNLLLELADRYVWMSHPEYLGKLIHIFNKMPDNELENLNKIILFPIVNPDDEAKTKSGHGILMTLRGARPFFEKCSHITWKEVETFKSFYKPEFTLGENEMIFLLDDFLGTGNTIQSTIEKLLISPQITIDKLRVVTIASHIQAVEYMNNIGLRYYTDLISPKGISDYYVSPDLEEKIAVMKDIEKLLPSRKYSFGYGKSEALITLYRTPNNTFPIFWHDYEKNEKKYKAPFPRY